MPTDKARNIASVAFALMWLAPVARAQSDGLQGGKGYVSSAECVTPAELADANARADAFMQSFGPVSSSGLGDPPKFEFYPMGGILWEDLFTNNFVDLNTGFGIQDWDCSGYTYNGHDASDTDLLTFGEQAIGVPIFAAADGTVVAVQDGFADMNNCPNSPCSSAANFVILAHSGARRTYYWHFKKDSIAVGPGQTVAAGEQLGLTGSSGNSSWSHLHFAVYDNNGARLVEPYAGPCRFGQSEWVDQTPIHRSMYMRDFGLTYENMSLFAGHPQPFPRSGQFALSDGSIYVWAMIGSVAPGTVRRIRIQRPDGTIARDQQNTLTNSFFRWGWWWSSYNVPDMHSIRGTWHVLYDLNGVRQITAPIEVRTARTADFNQPPEPIDLELEPAVPTVERAPICRVLTDRVFDDRDYDIVRYHYVWTVNGGVVRDVTTAGRADMIAKGTVAPDDLLECSVTPTDGKDAGPTASISAVVASLAPPALVPEAAPTDKDRSVSFIVPVQGANGENAIEAVANETALRLTLVSLYHPNDPQPVDQPDYSGSEGQVRYVNLLRDLTGNPVTTCVDSPASGTSYRCATVGCAPEYLDWAGLFGGESFHVSGSAIIPDSVYGVEQLAAFCSGSEATCVAVSSALTLTTGRYGDADHSASTTVTDVVLTVDVVKQLPGAVAEYQVYVRSANPTPHLDATNVTDIVLHVDALKLVSYVLPITTCP